MQPNKNIPGGEKKILFYNILLLFTVCSLLLTWSCAPPKMPVLERREAHLEREFDLIDRNDEEYLSQRISAYIDKEIDLVEDEALNDYLDQLGERIISQSRYRAYGAGYEWSFKMYDSAYTNAFTTLGGKVYVSRSMIEATKNESELAGILAYEIAHTMARNLHQHLSHEALSRGEVSPGEMISGEAGLESLYHVFKDKRGVMDYFARLTYYPEEVIQADKIAFYSCYGAGFNPHGLFDLAKRLWEEEREEPSSLWIKRNPWSSRREKDALVTLGKFSSAVTPEDSVLYIQLKNQLQQLEIPPLIIDEEVSVPEYVLFHRVKVLGNVDWSNSGFNVQEGQEIHFQATGGISLQVGNPLAECGPEGYSRKTMHQPFPDQNLGALIGKVVYLISTDIDEETGEEIRNEIVEEFFIGAEKRVTMPISGRLYLGINEYVVGDNEGEFMVTIRLLK